MEERAEGIPELDREIEEFFSGLKDKEDLYTGRITLLEEQLREVREFREKAAEHSEKDRALRAELAAAKEAAAAASGALKKAVETAEKERARIAGLAAAKEAAAAAAVEQKKAAEYAEKERALLAELAAAKEAASAAVAEREKAGGYAEEARALRADLAAAKEEAAAARSAASGPAEEIKKLRDERDDLANKVSSLQFSIDSEKAAGAEREHYRQRAESALNRRGDEIRELKGLLEGAEAGLDSEKERVMAAEAGKAEAERKYLELKKELEQYKIKISQILGRLKAAAVPPAQEESRKALERELAEARRENGVLKAAVQRGDTAAVPAQESAEEAGRYSELQARYNELGDRVLALEESRKEMEQELTGTRLEKAADEDLIRSKNEEIMELKAAVEQSQRDHR